MGLFNDVLNKMKSKLASTEDHRPGGSVHIGLDEDARADYSIFRGYFDGIDYKDGMLYVFGWMVSANGPYDECVLYIDGIKRGKFERVKRPDVAKGLPTVKRAIDSGFQFRVVMPDVMVEGIIQICVKGYIRGKEFAVMETGFMRELYTGMPIPPPHLISRVDEQSSGEFYQLKGIQNFLEFRKRIETHVGAMEINRLLDWGCGSGRLLGFFYYYSNIPELYGCDIDQEAIEWAQKNYSKAQFTAISPYPPTDYPADTMDIIIGFSVFTHLDRKNQLGWLQEMKRILRPGGLFIATVHGLVAARTILDPTAMEIFLQEGFYDNGEDQRLRGVAPEDYYRAVFMTKAYIQNEWSPFFEVAEHLEQGASNYQDIVVLRKRAF
ncbi:MAG: class I SAM-dependent methyltransferase [bacterium]|jgi:SAM-dependent methyltransferase|nr:class I SAM-dependent methyltransferase [bacterium]